MPLLASSALNTDTKSFRAVSVLDRARAVIDILVVLTGLHLPLTLVYFKLTTHKYHHWATSIEYSINLH